MKFLDLNKEYIWYKKDVDLAIADVFQSGRYLLGDQLELFEKEFALLIGVKNAVGVKNCTDAITILVNNLLKINVNMPIILPNFGAYPTAVACKNITNNIYYVDVDNSLTIDTDKLPSSLKNGIVIQVHLFGNNGNPNIVNYVKENNHILIEDCAQSTGSGSGELGDYSVFSFYPTKPLASMGDGGMICSDNNLEEYKVLRFYGQLNNNIKKLGVNSRLDEIQSAILNVKIKKFQILNDKRIEIAKRYKKHIIGIKEWSKCIYHQFPILFNNRDIIIKELNKRDIPFMIHYPHHVSEIDVLTGRYNKVEYRVNDKIVSLPIHPFLKENEIQKVEEFLYKYKEYEYVN